MVRLRQKPSITLVLAVSACLILAVTSCQPVLTAPRQSVSPSPTETLLNARRGEHVEGDPLIGRQLWGILACQSCHGTFAEGVSGPSLRSHTLSLEAFADHLRSENHGLHPVLPGELHNIDVANLNAWLSILPLDLPGPLPNKLGLTTPHQLRAMLFADQLEHPSALATGPDDQLYVATLGSDPHDPAKPSGRILRLTDTDGDGFADRRTVVVTGLDHPTGLTWLNNAEEDPILLVTAKGGVYAIDDDGPVLVGPLPGGLTRQAYDLVTGTDGQLYVASGPAGDTLEPEPGAVWRFDPDPIVNALSPAAPETFVTGMRTASSIAFSPSGAIYIADSGLAWPWRDNVPDEVNLLLGGGDYGWPDVWGKPGEDSHTIGPMAELPPGAGASDLLFYSGSMFDEYSTDLLVALAGQAGAPEETSGKVVRVEIISDVSGYYSFVHDMIGGFGRPVALAEGSDGSIYVADAEAGSVVRLWRETDTVK
ncbi:MAG: PQQ-dependent sugar dehydrogenase [Chloroflexota bacterium]|nr:PQQ-dependent sugar dehydrogenase [Chloroflexota bacterium]